MSRVISFSRKFPAYHKRAGEPTLFVQMLYKNLDINPFVTDSLNPKLTQDQIKAFQDELIFEHNESTDYSKGHTIRALKKPFKVGEKFSPRCWSGLPYRSKQIILAPDIEVKKVWGFAIRQSTIYIEGIPCTGRDKWTLSENDALSLEDFENWFRIGSTDIEGQIYFEGQIICWDESINYSTF